MTFQDVETARKNYWDKLRARLIVSIIVSVVICALLFIIGSSNFFYVAIFIPVIFSIAVVIIVLVTRKEAAAYRKAYKGYFVEQSLQNIFTDLSYTHESGLDPNILRATGMINTGDVYTSNDLTIAKYKEVGFVQADAHIQREDTDSDGNTTYYTIFKGRFMIFEFPKKFNFKLELVGKKFRAYRIPGKDSKNNREMSKVQTESNEFNHAFKIFAQDGFESFYLLVPDVIAKIEDIAKRYNYKLLLGFYDNKLVVALDDGKDAFEPPKFTKPINEKQEMAKVRDDIKVITDFVDVISPRSMV